MDTSIEPSAAPKKNSEMASPNGVPARANAGKISAKANPVTPTRGLLPKREQSGPVSSIEAMDPTPIHRSSRPSVPLLTPSRDFTKGTKGAQAAMLKPLTKKAMRVASRVAGVSALGMREATCTLRPPWRP